MRESGKKSWRKRVALAWNASERYALYAAVFSLPLQALALVPGTSLTVAKVAGASLIVGVFIRRVAGGRWPYPRTGLETGIAAFGAACVLSLAGSVERGASWSACATLIQYALVFYAVTDVAAHDEARETIPWLLIGAAALSGIGGALAYAGCVPGTVDILFIHTKVRRVCYGLLDANEQAMLYLFALVFLLFMRNLWNTRSRKIVSGCAFVAIAAGMVLTMSRTGWLGMGSLLVARLGVGRRPWRILVGLTVGVVVSGWVVSWIKPDLADTVRRRALEGVTAGDMSIASRVAHYAAVIDVAQAGGALGHGLATAEKLGRAILDPMGNPAGTIIHNVPFIIWLETGWIGLVTFGWLWSLVIALLYRGYRLPSSELQRDRVAAYAALIAMYGLVSLFMPFIYRSALPVLLGCAVGVLSQSVSSRSDSA